MELKFARAGDDEGQLLEKAKEQILKRHYGENAHPELKHIRMALVFSAEKRQFVESACF